MKKFKSAAEKVHTELKAKTNCFVDGKIVKATQIVAIDDDATSAMWAARMFYEIRKTHGYCPQIICVGGKGLMSKHTHAKSEAELLAHVASKLGISSKRISILGEGRNTGDNVLAVAKNSKETDITLWCVTQRLSLRLERTQAKQAPELKSYYFVIEQSLDEVMRLYNGKGICDGEMLYHELASILNRCEGYAGTFQEPINFMVSDEVRAAAELLEKNFRLKLPKKTIKSYFQFLRLYFAIKQKKAKMRKDLDNEIRKFASILETEKLVGPGDRILNRWIPTEIVGYTPRNWNGCHGWSCETSGGEPIYAEPKFPYNLK